MDAPTGLADDAGPSKSQSQKPIMIPRALRLLFLLLPLLLAAAAILVARMGPAGAQAYAPIPPPVAAPSPALAPSPAPVAPNPDSIAGLLVGEGDLVLSGRHLDRVQLAAIYEKRDFRPLWNDQRRAELMAALADAPSHGLDPGAFALPETDRDRGDILLTDAFLRYAQALARGRVSPGDFETDWLM